MYGKQILAAAVLLSAVCLLPLLLSGPQLTIYVLICLAIVVTCGLSLLMGYAGQVSFGQGAFYGIGAYTAALVALSGYPTVIGLVLSPVLAMAAAVVIGFPLLRLKGFYLGFATLAVHLVLLNAVSGIEALGGDIGLTGIPPLKIAGVTFSSGIEYAYLVSGLAILTVFLNRQILSSRFGRAFRAVATSEAAAESCGIAVFNYKTYVFVLSAGYAGLAGGVYAFFFSYVSPSSFALLLSFQFVVMSVVGGSRSLLGPVLGAVIVTILVQGLNSLGTMSWMPPSAPIILSYGTYSVLVIVIVLFSPNGLAPAIFGQMQNLLGSFRPARSGGVVPAPNSESGAVQS